MTEVIKVFECFCQKQAVGAWIKCLSSRLECTSEVVSTHLCKNEWKGANCLCLFGKGLVGERDLGDAISAPFMPVVTVSGKNAWNLLRIPGFFFP